MEQKFGKNSIDIEALREFCEREGKEVTYRKGDQLEREGDPVRWFGFVTDEREHPRLNVRLWSGPSPRRYVLSHATTPSALMAQMYADGMQSLIVEGGGQTLRSFIDAGLWDEIRVETSPQTVGGGTPAPLLPEASHLVVQEEYGQNVVRWYHDKKRFA